MDKLKLLLSLLTPARFKGRATLKRARPKRQVEVEKKLINKKSWDIRSLKDSAN